MAPGEPFRGEPEDTREAIMAATYRALREHGYADLTIQRIGDAFGKSKSLLYHHYDGKDELLVEFLEYMLDRFESEVPIGEGGSAADRLDALLDHALPATVDDERAEFARAIVELRVQAAHKPAYREHFTRSDRFLRDRIAAVIEAGVEAGEFRDVDAEAVADLLLSTITGAMVERATTDDDGRGRTVRAEVDEYLRRRLYAEEP